MGFVSKKILKWIRKIEEFSIVGIMDKNNTKPISSSPSSDDRSYDQLENRIKDLPGVKRVNNHIQVKSEAAIAEEDNLYNPEEQKIENERVNDDEDYDDEDEDDLDETSSGDQYFNDSDKTLIDSIRSTIQKDKLLFPVASKIKIIAEEGDITITGSVDSDQQKKLIAEKIKRIKEVKTLDNQLYVRKKATEG